MSVPAAFLVYSGRAYFSSWPVQGSPEALTDTPITRLIEGIWDQEPAQAFHLLRSRIYVNYALTPRCRGSIKLAAKRVTELEPDEFQKQIAFCSEPREIAPGSGQPALIEPPQASGLDALAAWTRSYPFSGPHRPILATLLGPDGKAVLSAFNTSSRNRLHHAEVTLIREAMKRYGRKIASGSSILVSLKPCRMCGSFIEELCEDGVRTPVYYLEDDPGPMARQSPLRNTSIYRFK